MGLEYERWVRVRDEGCGAIHQRVGFGLREDEDEEDEEERS